LLPVHLLPALCLLVRHLILICDGQGVTPSLTSLSRRYRIHQTTHNPCGVFSITLIATGVKHSSPPILSTLNKATYTSTTDILLQYIEIRNNTHFRTTSG
jgi:hypothetical protein